MKKISIYVSNELLKPANYYRIVQYANKIPNTKVYNIYPTKLFQLVIKYRGKRFIRKILEKILTVIANYRIKKYIKEDLNDLPDIVVVQKSMTKYPIKVKTQILREELINKTELIWDFDDHIVEDKQITKEEYDLYCKKAKTIIVTNDYLKETLPKNVQKKVKLLPTTDLDLYINNQELEKINNKRLVQAKSRIELLWLATSANIPYLEEILPVLEYTAKILKVKYNKELVLKSVCDKKIKNNCHFLTIENIKWSRNIAIEEIKKSYIGIMPLIETSFSKGKGGFKLIQYIATGLPIIASNVGYNKELFKKEIGYLLDDQENKNNWKDAIIELANNEKKWLKYSKNAKKVWEESFNASKNLEVWKKILK